MVRSGRAPSFQGMPPERRRTLLTLLSLGLLYTVWGSTYLAQRVALRSFEPLQMNGVRFTIAGAVVFGALRARGAPLPTLVEWRAVALSAGPLIVTGMGMAAAGLKRVPSGLAALVFGSVPLWTSLIDRLWGGSLRRIEALGLAIGFAGVAVVSLRGGLSADPTGALLLLGAAASYSLGCVLTRRLALPRGMLGTAAQMLFGGVVLMGVSLLIGERPRAPSATALLSLSYLIVLGSIAGYVALGYLLRTVRPALATSYAFVNPIVALVLGAALAGERIERADVLGLVLVLAAVGLVALGQRIVSRFDRPADLRPTCHPTTDRHVEGVARRCDGSHGSAVVTTAVVKPLAALPGRSLHDV
jgi:drug/metabolite transporter (DMT)-like permease